MLSGNVEDLLNRIHSRIPVESGDVVKEAAEVPAVSDALIDEINEALTGTDNSPRLSTEKVAFAQLLVAGDVLAKKGP